MIILASVCTRCNFITRKEHAMLWCPNCGAKLNILPLEEEDYYQASELFYKTTNFSLPNASFNFRTGEPENPV